MSKPTTRNGPVVVRGLIEDFRVIHGGSPPWAWPFVPSVPFVGKRYKPGKGFFIYASAENLSWLNRQRVPGRFVETRAWNRYRVVYEEKGKENGDFFPDVGIAPVNHGGLLAAGLFLSESLGLPAKACPREFLEYIAVTNWCKFTVKGERNRDYLGHRQYMLPSLPFVISELSRLRPRVVLIPKGIMNFPVFARAMQAASPGTEFLAAYQFNATVVNCHLGDYQEAGARLSISFEGSSLARWMDNLAKVPRGHAWRYMAYLDSIASAIPPPGTQRGHRPVSGNTAENGKR